MLLGRTFAYADTHRYRIGPSYLQLPVNRHRLKDACTYQFDGPTACDHAGDRARYAPNSYIRKLAVLLVRYWHAGRSGTSPLARSTRSATAAPRMVPAPRSIPPAMIPRPKAASGARSGAGVAGADGCGAADATASGEPAPGCAGIGLGIPAGAADVEVVGLGTRRTSVARCRYFWASFGLAVSQTMISSLPRSAICPKLLS